MTKMYKTTVNYKGDKSPLVSIHPDESKSLDVALEVLKYHNIDADSIESIETKEII